MTPQIRAARPLKSSVRRDVSQKVAGASLQHSQKSSRRSGNKFKGEGMWVEVTLQSWLVP